MSNNSTTVPSLLASYTPGQIDFINFLQVNRKALTVYDTCTVSRKDLVELIVKGAYIAVPAWIASNKARRAGRGNYFIPELNATISALTVNTNNRGRKAGSRNQKGRATTAGSNPSTVNLAVNA